MKMYVGAALLAVLALGGCGQESADKAASAVLASASPDTPPDIPVAGPERAILAFGDSLFAGYGLKDGESYPARLEAALRARGVNARIRNASVSGDTTAAGLQRLAFTLDSQPQAPELVLVSLGGNDVLRGLPPEETRKNLDAILTELGRRGSKAVLMGMLAPPNLGADYRRRFDAIYPALARKHGAVLVPFFLQAVIDKPDLIQPDRIHPTARGIEEIVVATAGRVGEALPPLEPLPPQIPPKAALPNPR
ncbi:MAG: arylesterase [Novosphingobium sp.]|nr:arylesterase [Novosphingobium sp.]